MNKNTDKYKPKSGAAYYLSSQFFPKGIRDDVFKLYSFVRTVSNFIDESPVDVGNFEHIESRWLTIKGQLARLEVPSPLDDSASERVLCNIAYVVHRHRCDPAWVDAFLKSKRWDMQKHQYRALKDILEYMYGSAEVIGLFMARILDLPEEALKAARYQARAIQYITFLRDIPKNTALARNYFPMGDVKKFGLKNLSEAEARAKPGMFADFMHAQLLRYAQWQTEANEGFIYVPKRLRVPLHTAVDMYNWTAQELKYNPLVVYDKQLKPKKRRVVRGVIRRSITS